MDLHQSSQQVLGRLGATRHRWRVTMVGVQTAGLLRRCTQSKMYSVHCRRSKRAHHALRHAAVGCWASESKPVADRSDPACPRPTAWSSRQAPAAAARRQLQWTASPPRLSRRRRWAHWAALDPMSHDRIGCDSVCNELHMIRPLPPHEAPHDARFGTTIGCGLVCLYLKAAFAARMQTMSSSRPCRTPASVPPEAPL